MQTCRTGRRSTPDYVKCQQRSAARDLRAEPSQAWDQWLGPDSGQDHTDPLHCCPTHTPHNLTHHSSECKRKQTFSPCWHTLQYTNTSEYYYIGYQLCCRCSNGGNVTSAGWQVTLCDPIWHVSSHSSEACCKLRHCLLTYSFTWRWLSSRVASVLDSGSNRSRDAVG